MEGDEGTYTCNVMILETIGLQLVELQSIIIGFLCCKAVRKILIGSCVYMEHYKSIKATVMMQFTM